MYQCSKLRLAQIEVFSNILNIQGLNIEDPGRWPFTALNLSRFLNGRKQFVEQIIFHTMYPEILSQ